MHISLTPKLEEMVRNKVDSGLYNNASELMREALRLMIQREQDHGKLQSAITRGFEQIEAGQFTEIDSKEELFEMARARRKTS